MGELFRVRQDESQDRHIDGLPLGTVGGLLIQTTLPLDGEYQFQVRLFRTNLGTMRGLEYPHQLEISVNGQRVHLASFGGDTEVAVDAHSRLIKGLALYPGLLKVASDVMSAWSRAKSWNGVFIVASQPSGPQTQWPKIG